MLEVSASKTEELELLCEKLGPESSKQAKTIRSNNAENPGVACDKIWERLEKRYGAPEMVEARLNNRIKDFPIITAEKYHLLYDLTDLALEVSAIKSQPRYSALFAYFDSKKGVNELVDKLPWHIKEKWTSEATRYKQQKKELYPPFDFFVKFLEKMASMRNDPAFQYERKVGSHRQTPASQQTRHKSSPSTKQRSNPEKAVVVYATIDDQSNQSLGTSSLFDYFDECSTDVSYTLVSCSGAAAAAGSVCTGNKVQSLDNSCELGITSLLECNDIPSDRSDIPSPDVARQFPHLSRIVPLIPPVIKDADMELLLGRDVIRAHVVEDQVVGEEDQPFAQKLPLGWVIVGQVCLGGAHVPEVRTMKTYVLGNGRHSRFQPCENELYIHKDLFQKTDQDEKVGLSIEDHTFLRIMEDSFVKDEEGHWVAPLPFKDNRIRLPNNRSQALRRAGSLDRCLRHNDVKRAHVIDFMKKLFDRGHAEKAPDISDDEECWFLPMFGVYHPKKPDSVRVVFDSSAQCEGTSLNDVLIKGPDLANNLQGILMRFRLEEFAIMADVEQMFHNFRVAENHRNYLRFFWHSNNDLDSPLEEFRMTVHVFGNRTSPAVTNYGLRRSVSSADPDVQSFVSNNFYVDDGLMSFPSTDQAVDLVKRTQTALRDGGGLRLHKIASNSTEILEQFPKEDLAKDLKNLDLGQDCLPEQRSLGICWHIVSDNFSFRVDQNSKPFTRRGVLSVINSLFDPIGFTAPVTLEGKILMREAMTSKSGWDESLPEEFRIHWEKWVDELGFLQNFSISRMYCSLSVELSSRVELHVFSDASKDAVAAVAYIKVFSDETNEMGFLTGKAKVAPVHGHTIPRLELCASLLAVEIAENVREQLDVPKDVFTFYTDSRVVLGYISNESKRFHVYVANRVSRIRSFCGPQSWKYVASAENPADVLVDPDEDVEVRKQVTCLKASVSCGLGCQRFDRFSTWSGLVRAITCLKRFIRKRQSRSIDGVKLKVEAERFIIKQVQQEAFGSEICAIGNDKNIPKDSSLLPLCPILDSNGILRVGGRLEQLKCENDDPCLKNHPIVIPKNHHIGELFTRKYHTEVHHQGRHLTEGAIRSAGYWIVGGRRVVNSVIHSCVTCKRLRGKLGWTHIAQLPSDRVEPGPAFSFVGVDVFGPWPVVVKRSLRGSTTSAKRWGVLFTCLVSRAVHIELVEEMSSCHFINALRRFTAIRGPVRQFRSDRGSNFVGAVKELGISTSFVEDGPVQDFLSNAGHGITWVFNPPYAHHFGGVWERMVGSCRRILDAMRLENRSKDLTHDTLATFMAEVSAIINSRPLLPVSSDPELPSVLSPMLILTQKPYEYVSEPDVTGFGPKDALKSQRKFVQRMADGFWCRWKRDYLHQLQVCRKWQLPGDSFKENDIVLMKDDMSHRNNWPIGIIEEVYPSKDNVVRKVKLSVIRGKTRVSFVRPISELVRLVEFE
ncbi:uncharacterized protein LOC110445733 [Mizuhopecten yessoensis]|uniref:uncharacterized protein LOC110445733 n=1 Tax=Mizuhopecten yessoensis TaxID=6573 RepID=UPI000B459FDC|nr:uncharacterized protein LOC110445733 [Mizuhopecten yessoensis]